MRPDRLKMIKRAVKLYKHKVRLNAKFDRSFWIYALPEEKARDFCNKAFAAIERKNIVAAREEDFGMCRHVRAYKMPSPKQLANFEAVVTEFLRRYSHG